MARERAPSMNDGIRAPHCISLKVLRLSRPGFYSQFPVPVRPGENEDIAKKNLPYPTADPEDQFILTPLLMLPPGFGPVHVGESFSCTLAANNDSRIETEVQNILIAAEIQTPSQKLSLALLGPNGTEPTESENRPLKPSDSIQRTLSYDLTEEGAHVLAVTVSYKECPKEGPERLRSFRKLYQFSAQQLLVVRTKIGELSSPAGSKGKQMRVLLEAQVENMGASPINITTVTVNPKTPFKSRSLNWDTELPAGIEQKLPPMLQPRDVMQIAFLVEQSAEDTTEDFVREVEREGRASLGQLSIKWMGHMGEKGSLSTGWLSTKRK